MRRGGRAAVVPGRHGPGVLGTLARTALISGTATAVSRSVSSSMDAAAQQRALQEQQRALQEQQRIDAAVQQALAQQAHATQPPAAESSDARIARLQQLAELKRQGILSEEEFAA